MFSVPSAIVRLLTYSCAAVLLACTSGLGSEGGNGGSQANGGSGGFDDPGSGGTGGKGGAEPVEPLDPNQIEGRVLYFGIDPVEGAVVAINGDFDNVLRTASDGSFSFSDVEKPYRLTVIGGGILTDIEWLNTSTPVVDLGHPDPVWRSHIQGYVRTDKLPPSSSGESIVVSMRGNMPLAVHPIDHLGGWFGDDFLWAGAKTLSTELTAVHLREGSGCIDAYLGTGRSERVHLEGGRKATAEIYLNGPAPESHQVQFTHSVGLYNHTRLPGEASPFASISSVFVDRAPYYVRCVADDYSGPFKLPKEGAQFLLMGKDELGTSAFKLVRSNESQVDLRFSSEPIQTISPEYDAKDVPLDPTFRWIPMRGAALQIVRVWGNREGREHRWVLPGDVESISFPVRDEFAPFLGPGSQYHWSVTAVMSKVTSEDFLRGILHMDPYVVLDREELELYRTQNKTFYTKDQ